MTEQQWWDLIFATAASADDPDLRLGFALWLQDEQDDPGAGYLWWLLDTSGVEEWSADSSKQIRGPRVGSYSAWWRRCPARPDYNPENNLPGDVAARLTPVRDYNTTSYPSRRAAEEDALRAWRLARPHLTPGGSIHA